MVGIDISMAMRAASLRVKPALRAPVMVMPEREVPGISASSLPQPKDPRVSQCQVLELARGLGTLIHPIEQNAEYQHAPADHGDGAQGV